MTRLTFTQRVTSPDRDTIRVAARRHQFAVGAPLEFDAEAPRLSALDHAFGALGAEIVGGLRAFAKRRRLVLDQIEAVVSVDVDSALGYLEVVGEAGRPRVARVHVKVYLSSGEAEAALRRLWQDTLDRLPLVRTLGPAVDLALDLTLTP